MHSTYVIGLVVCSCLSLSLYSQTGNTDDKSEKKIFIDNERTWGILINSNGWGANFRYGKRIDGFTKHLYEFDFVNIKNPKEVKISHPNFPNGQRFVFGKENLLFNFRFGYGLQKEKFSKISKGGIEIRYFYALGPIIGFLKPIYYDVIINYNPFEIKSQKFNAISSHSTNDIYGRASFFKGFNEIEVVPGAFCKFGASFEYSSKENRIKAIEAGIAVDAFPKRMPIMALKTNPYIFVCLFASYRFGKILNPLDSFNRKRKITPNEKQSQLPDLERE